MHVRWLQERVCVLSRTHLRAVLTRRLVSLLSDCSRTSFDTHAFACSLACGNLSLQQCDLDRLTERNILCLRRACYDCADPKKRSVRCPLETTNTADAKWEDYCYVKYTRQDGTSGWPTLTHHRRAVV